MDWLWPIIYWHWWAFALLLIVAEVFVPSTVLIWPAISAVLVGVLVAFVPEIGWTYQVFVFSLLALASSLLWFFWLRQRWMPEDGEEDNGLNRRTGRYVGRKLTLTAPMPGGEGRLQLDDGWWSARSESGAEIAEGTVVEIVASEATTLIVRPVGPA